MFDHEKLRVYQKTLAFNEWVGVLLSNIKEKISVYDHIDEASASIALNIAEGNGKFTSKDRCRYFDIARGSALECASCFDILIKRGKLSEEDVLEGKKMLVDIVSMLIGLINSNSDRVFEAEQNYNI
ncbi:MAG: four helix bundle protein [Ignavibacteria bacterium]